MTLKTLNIIGLLILGSVISSHLRFSCSFSKAGNLIHLNNLANAHIFLPRKFRMKIQKALDIFFFERYTVILGYQNWRTVWGEIKLIPCFYFHSFWQSHHMRDSEIVISMVCKSVQRGGYQRLEGPGSYSYLLVVLPRRLQESCQNEAKNFGSRKEERRHALVKHVLKVITLASGTACNTKVWVSEGLLWVMEICNTRGTAISAQSTFLQRAMRCYWWQELSNSTYHCSES